MLSPEESCSGPAGGSFEQICSHRIWKAAHSWRREGSF